MANNKAHKEIEGTVRRDAEAAVEIAWKGIDLSPEDRAAEVNQACALRERTIRETTDAFLRKVQVEWMEISKENVVEVRVIGNVVYCCCSELAALRMYHAYRGGSPTGKLVEVREFKHRGDWSFGLEMDPSVFGR
jgi:hypothetical protein